MKISQYTLIFLLFSIGISAQTLNDSLIKKLKAEIKEELRLEMKNEAKSATKTTSDLDKFELHGYAVANYYNYDYDTDPSLKDKIDAERLNIYPEYQFNDWIAFRSEIEFEHGGTGASIEYDTQEEFGEFEQEIEKGGSIKLERFSSFAAGPRAALAFARRLLSRQSAVTVGHNPLAGWNEVRPVRLGHPGDEPHDRLLRRPVIPRRQILGRSRVRGADEGNGQ